MAKIALRAERDFDYHGWGTHLGRQEITQTRGAPASIRITASIAAAAWRAAADAEAVAIVACTRSGGIARAVARFRPPIPILATTPLIRTARQLSVAWGITPLVVPQLETTDDIVSSAIAAAGDLGLVKTDDVVAVVVGTPDDPQPATNVVRLERIG